MEDLNQLKIVLARFTNIETYNRTVRSEHSRLNKLLVK